MLESDRIVFRRLEPTDWTWLSEMDHDSEVMEFLSPTFAPPPDSSSAHSFVQRFREQYEGTPWGAFVAVERSTNEVIGWMMLRPSRDYRYFAQAGLPNDSLDLGYRFRRAFWGRGLATEGSRALIEYARSHADGEFRQLVAVTMATNHRSRRVMEKLGMAYVGEWPVPGWTIPGVTYAILL